MKNPKELIKDKEGVSPVIGVILMVAITVIMAAIVAGFVFGVISTPEATPTASITVDDYTADTSVTLLHQSGDELTTSDLRVTIGGETYDASTDWSGDTWQSGTTETLNSTTFSEGDTIRIIHTPSGNTISEDTIE